MQSIRRIRPEPSTEFWTGERCWILELLNEAGSPGLSIARARVEPGVTTELHALDVREVYVILEGSGEMDTGAGAPLSVRPGDLVDIPAGAAQRICNTGGTDLVFLCVCTPRFTPTGYTDLET